MNVFSVLHVFLKMCNIYRKILHTCISLIYMAINFSHAIIVFTWCLVDKFRPHISAYQLGPCRSMANKNFVKEVSLEVGFLELSQKAFMKMKHFRKCRQSKFQFH